MDSIVRVTDQVGSDIDDLVASGHFASRDAVVAEGVRRLREEQNWLRMVEAKVTEGRAQIARGEGIPMDEAFDRVLASIAKK